MFKSKIFIHCLFSVALLLSANIQAQQIAYESIPITLNAKDVLSDKLLSGSNFQVADEIINDGLINAYVIKTDYGTFNIESHAMLIKRIEELNALAMMEELENSAVFTEALKGAGKSPFETISEVVEDPSGTVKKMGSGVSRWFGDVKRSVTSDDPHQPGALTTALGQAPVLRQFAYEFGVDPYTSFKPLEDELNEIAWVAVSGGLTVKAAFSAVGGNVGSALSLSGTAGGLKELVRDKSPDELTTLIEKYLNQLNVPPSTASTFIANNYFNPQEKVLLVGELVAMKEVMNRAAFLEVANTASSEEIALYMLMRAQIMGLYAKKQKASKIINASGVPFMQYTDGKVVGVFPLDYVFWTDTLETRSKEIKTDLAKAGINDVEIHVLGSVSPAAKKSLSELGWTVKERVISELGFK